MQPRLLVADFCNHALPGMHDGPNFAAESAETMRALREAGVCRAVFTPTYRPFFESVRRFCQRRQEAFRCLQPLLPRDMTVRLSAQVVLEPECCASPEIAALAIPGTSYLPVELPLAEYPDWMDFELHLLLHRRQLKPVFARFERCLLLYPESVSAKLMDIPGAAYQFSLSAAAEPTFSRAIRTLIRRDKAVLLGTGANLPAQKFPNLAEKLAAMRELLTPPLYIALLRNSYNFPCFSD